MTDLHVRRLAYALGAEVTGVDLKAPLDDATVARLRALWLEHLVLAFPRQGLTRDSLVDFAARFGDLEIAFSGNADPKSRHVSALSNRPVNGRPWTGYKSGSNWHIDKSHTTHPASATIQACLENPEIGGTTMFANTYMAYETLSPTLRRIVDGLWGIHDSAVVRDLSKQRHLDREGREALQRAVAARAKEYSPTVQPAVRTHPETGRKALYLGDRVVRFLGMTEQESRPLLDFLNHHAASTDFTYRHQWSPGDVLMWDNRCTVHIAVTDYDLQKDLREMLVVQVRGEDSGFPYREELDLSPPAMHAAAGQHPG